MNENYASFLLRIWRTNSAEAWRASLITVGTGHEQTFADLNAVMPFVTDALGKENPHPNPLPEGEGEDDSCPDLRCKSSAKEGMSSPPLAFGRGGRGVRVLQKGETAWLPTENASTS